MNFRKKCFEFKNWIFVKNVLNLKFFFSNHFSKLFSNHFSVLFFENFCQNFFRHFVKTFFKIFFETFFKNLFSKIFSKLFSNFFQKLLSKSFFFKIKHYSRSLWLASIWWEAGYQQGKSDSRSPTCNEIRVSMVEKDMFTEDQLPNCHTNGHWTVRKKSKKFHEIFL